MDGDTQAAVFDNGLLYEDYETIKISKHVPFEVEFETLELEQQHKFGMNAKSASIVSSAGPEIMVTVGLLMFLAALASFGYYYLSKRRSYQHGQPLSTPSDSSVDVEKLDTDSDSTNQQKVQFDRRFDNLS